MSQHDKERGIGAPKFGTTSRLVALTGTIALILFLGEGVSTLEATSSSSMRAMPTQVVATHNLSAKALRALGHDALKAGKPREAVEFFERALQRQIADAGDSNELAMEAMVDLAFGYMWLDEDSKAHELAMRAVSIADQIGPATNPERVSGVRVLSDALIALGDYAKAETLITDVVRTSRNQFGPDHVILASPLTAEAQLRYAQGRLPEAEELVREVARIEARARGNQSLATANARNLLSAILVDRGKFKEAEVETRIVIEIASRYAAHGPHPLEVSAKHIRGEALMGLGEYARAEIALKEELAALNQAGAAGWRIARAASALGEVYLHERDLPEAERYLVLANNKLTRTKGWPMEREARNLARRLDELDALQPKRVSARE
jgi:tetratricopeptide (TPR) repeat protein